MMASPRVFGVGQSEHWEPEVDPNPPGSSSSAASAATASASSGTDPSFWTQLDKTITTILNPFMPIFQAGAAQAVLGDPPAGYRWGPQAQLLPIATGGQQVTTRPITGTPSGAAGGGTDWAKYAVPIGLGAVVLVLLMQRR